MNIQHFEKDLYYTDRELLLLAKKLGKLATHCRRLKDEASFIRVEAERRPTKKDEDAVKVMITVVLPHKTLRAESRKFLVLDAVDSCVGKLTSPLEAYKELHTRKGKVTKFRRRERQKQDGERRRAA